MGQYIAVEVSALRCGIASDYCEPLWGWRKQCHHVLNLRRDLSDRHSTPTLLKGVYTDYSLEPLLALTPFVYDTTPLYQQRSVLRPSAHSSDEMTSCLCRSHNYRPPLALTHTYRAPIPSRLIRSSFLPPRPHRSLTWSRPRALLPPRP